MSGTDVVFDQADLMDRVDDDLEFLEETVAMLEEDSPALLQAVRDATEARDADALASSAHALKGMLANFCAPAAVAAALTLETMGRQQQLAEAPPAMQQVETEVARLLEALRRFIQAGAQ